MIEVIVLIREVSLDELGDGNLLEIGQEILVVESLEFIEEALLGFTLLGLKGDRGLLGLHKFELTLLDINFY